LAATYRLDHRFDPPLTLDPADPQVLQAIKLGAGDVKLRPIHGEPDEDADPMDG
jgi:hypothetical protein